MPVSRPCYCNRTDVKRALDFEGITASSDARIDRALATVAETIEGQMHRVFYPRDTTFYFDWPLRTTPTPTRGGCGWTSGTWSCAPRCNPR
jgi:hypothetical protein